jgi:hypothetical protein
MLNVCAPSSYSVALEHHLLCGTHCALTASLRSEIVSLVDLLVWSSRSVRLLCVERYAYGLLYLYMICPKR